MLIRIFITYVYVCSNKFTFPRDMMTSYRSISITSVYFPLRFSAGGGKLGDEGGSSLLWREGKGDKSDGNAPREK